MEDDRGDTLPPVHDAPAAIALSAAVSPDSRATLTLPQCRHQLAVIDALRAGDKDTANRRFRVLVESIVQAGVPRDIDGLINGVVRESYLAAQEDLRVLAERVTCLNEQKRLFRAELARVRELRTQVEGPTAREAVASMIDEFEKKLHAVSDDAQLANVDLQNLLQQQQEVVQIMSNISKMLYDTAQAVIRKIGG